MKLPNRHRAVVPRAKLTEYLLSTSHPYGRHKTAFFTRFGFDRESWEVLASALLAHADEHEVASADDTQFGMRYTVEGGLRAPDGRTPNVRVVWFVEKGDDRPRLITVYPVGRGTDD
ncbi:MAG: DUF6883 domain-containing protein [Chloroflexota bacterium]